MDVNEIAVQTINKGRIHIVEPDLDMVVHAAAREGRLRATLKPEAADAFLIAVPTPFRDGHEPDLSYIEAAARAIAPVLAKGNLVVLESTSPVGTTEQIAAWLAGEIDRETMVERATAATRQYAKRQYTWFRQQPPAHWRRVEAQLDDDNTTSLVIKLRHEALTG